MFKWLLGETNQNLKTAEELIDWAGDWFKDSKFTEYSANFTKFNKDYVNSNFENFENFRTNWKTIIYVTIKGIYSRLGNKELIEIEQFSLALAGLLKKADFYANGVENKKRIDLYSEAYSRGGNEKTLSAYSKWGSHADMARILNKNCFYGNMDDETINLVGKTIHHLEAVWDEMTRVWLSWEIIHK